MSSPLHATLLCAALLACPLFGALPRDVKLANGATLRNVSVVRWTDAETVVLKHAGGVDPIRLRHIQPEHRQAFEALRDQPAAPAAVPETARTIKGEVFVATLGAGTYKFGNVLVTAFPAERYDEFLARVRAEVATQQTEAQVYTAAQKVARDMEYDAVATARSNSEGAFEIETDRDVFVVATASRAYRTTTKYPQAPKVITETELNAWAVKADGSPLILSNTNQLAALVLER